MFPRLEQEGQDITGSRVSAVLSDVAFAGFSDFNVLPLIYDENRKQCNILVFDFNKAMHATTVIKRQNVEGRRKHPAYRFFDKDGGYICEVRYGDAKANALQRGFWTHSQKGLKYFDSITNGWIDYSHNYVLVKLFSHALISSSAGHSAALEKIKEDIDLLKKKEGLSK